MSTLLRRSTVVILIAALCRRNLIGLIPAKAGFRGAGDGRQGVVEATVANTRAGEVESCRRARLALLQEAGSTSSASRKATGGQGQVLMRLWKTKTSRLRRRSRMRNVRVRRNASPKYARWRPTPRDARRQMDLKARGFVSASVAERAGRCRFARRGLRDRQGRRAIGQRADPGQPRRAAPQRAAGPSTAPSPRSPASSANTPPLASGVATPPAIDLIDESCLYVRAPMDEVDAPKIQPGQTVRVTIDALPGKVFAARVKRIAPYVAAVEKQARTVDVDVDFVAPEAARVCWWATAPTPR